jgi:hypothetical protein
LMGACIVLNFFLLQWTIGGFLTTLGTDPSAFLLPAKQVLCHWATPTPKSFSFLCVCVVLGFDLRTSRLLGRCCTIWAILSAPSLAFGNRVSLCSQGWTNFRSPCPCLPSTEIKASND